MPCIRDKGTADKIAEIFTGNGRNKEQAMLEIGYTKQYAKGGRGKDKVYSNVLVKQAIAKIDAKTSAAAGYDRAESMKRKQVILDAIQAQVDKGNLDAARTANAILQRMDNICGLERQDIHDHTEQPEPMTAEQRAQLQDMAKTLTKPKLHTA